MVIYSVDEAWGHAMLVQPTGDGFSTEPIEAAAEVSVVHHAPPLTSNDKKTLSRNHYLGVYDGVAPPQDEVLKDVCAAITEIRARATATPALGLLKKPGCYSIAPAGILKPISNATGTRTTSCAGLVEECYREAGVPLVDDSTLPTMSFGDIRSYVEQFDARFTGRPDLVLRKRLGLDEVAAVARPLFTSYQMRAFEQSTYPYAVKADDPKDVLPWR